MEVVFNQSITRLRLFIKNEVHDKYLIVDNYKRKVGKKYLFLPRYEIVEKAILYNYGLFCHLSFMCSIENFDGNVFIEDNKFYEKPHCIIYLSDQSSSTIWFETEVQCLGFVDDLLSKYPNTVIN